MKLTTKDLSSIRHIEFRNKELLKGRRITGVSTDSRITQPGDLFVALRGDRFDGHNFINEAIAKQAAAAVVEKTATLSMHAALPLLVVEDTMHALGELAHLHRMKFDIPVIAVAGSNGKTTTKEMIARVLMSAYRVLSTEGNLNNQIGVPLTLLRLQKRHEIAIVEIGTNHPGEIAYLCEIVHPTHGMITNIGREHLEFFHSLDGVATEQGALFDTLKAAKNAEAFVNANDEYVVRLARGIRNVTTYGFGAKRSGVRGKLLGADASGCPRFQFATKKMSRGIPVQLAVPGTHHALNGLAAAAVGVAFGVAPTKIRKALERFHPASRRMELVEIAGVTVYNDSYNANPDSMIAALRTLAAVNVPGKKIAVLGDMLELGRYAEEEHARVGKEVTTLDLDYLLTYGEMSRHAQREAKIQYAIHYDQKNVLAEYLAELIAPGDAVLIKGSRGMKMEDIVTFLQERFHAPAVSVGSMRR